MEQTKVVITAKTVEEYRSAVYLVKTIIPLAIEIKDKKLRVTLEEIHIISEGF